MDALRQIQRCLDAPAGLRQGCHFQMERRGSLHFYYSYSVLLCGTMKKISILIGMNILPIKECIFFAKEPERSSAKRPIARTAPASNCSRFGSYGCGKGIFYLYVFVWIHFVSSWRCGFNLKLWGRDGLRRLLTRWKKKELRVGKMTVVCFFFFLVHL